MSQDKRSATRWWSREDLLLLILLGALYFLPGLGQTPLFDRDEPRFATAAREMLVSGDYIVPHFNTHLRPDKPPLIYWLMAASYRALGAVSGLAARLPSAIAGILTLLVVYFMTGSRFGRVTGLMAALILGSCALFVAESRLATADSTMILFTVICMACAWQAWDAAGGAGEADGRAAGHLARPDFLRGSGSGKNGVALDHVAPRAPRKMPWWLALVFWISLAGGTLTKGVPLFFVLVPLVVLSMATGTLPAQLRRWRSHLHVTRIRIGLALAVTATVVVLLATGAANWPIAILGALVVGMILTPGLPGVLARCITGGNWRWWKNLRPLVGIPLLVVLVGWWVVLAGMRTHWKLIDEMVGVHFLARVAGPLLNWLHVSIVDVARPGGNDAMADYSKPPGFYLLLVWATFWPWSVLLLPAAFHAVRRALGKTALAIDPRPYQFLLAWIVPMWIALELARGKLLHYPLPLYVAIAILCADVMVQGWHRLTDVLATGGFEVTRWIALTAWLVMAAGALLASHQFMSPEFFWKSVPLAGAFVAAGVGGTIAWNRPSWPFVTVLGWAAALLLLNTMLMPEMPGVQVGPEAGTALAALKKADPSLHLAAQGFDQPTLVFYAGGPVAMPTLDAAGHAVWVLNQIPWGPAPIPATMRYAVAVNQSVIDEMTRGHFRFYIQRRIPGGPGVTGNQENVIIITNVPEKSGTTNPATGTRP